MQITPPIIPRSDPMYQRAQQMEAAFLSEMLSFAGLGEQETTLGGGIGEGQFSSFLRDEQARLIVQKGGIGLAETLFRAMGGTDAE
ncbi:MAG: rod-binding protein [Paracoccaceae bacterium]